MSKIKKRTDAHSVEVGVSHEVTKMMDERIAQQPKVEKSERREILRVDNLKMYFPVTKGLMKRTVGYVKAVDDVSFRINQGETLGIVGESGSGKSTVGNCVMRNYNITGGHMMYNGIELENQTAKQMRSVHKSLTMITQDPYASLDPRKTVSEVILEGPKIHHMYKTEMEGRDIVGQMLELVGLNPKFANRYPHEFSGGQRQRISIARALAMNPSFIVCDEIVSALDVSIQAQIVSLMMKVQQELGLTYIFIGHDLSVVRHLSNQVAVMYLGKIMELTDSDELYNNPQHPYTQALISAAPIPNPTADRARQRILLEGEVPSPINPPKGCNFCTRCRYADKRCMEEEPEMVDVGNNHLVACHRVCGQ
jgi:oligopeptide transport system ATP-binding protein